MNILETLKKVRCLIHIPQRWVKGWIAKTNKGDDCDANDIKACRFCLEGAINKVTGKTFCSPEFKKIQNIILYEVNSNKNENYTLISEFNDDDKTTHKDILEALDDTIKQEENKL